LANAEAQASYRADGVAVVPGAFAAWVDHLLPRARALIDAAVEHENATGERRALKFLWRTEPAFRAFAFESGAGPLAASSAGSRTIRLALDQIWAKPPRSREMTRWHCDRPAWPVTGMMLPSVWVPLTPVRPENSLAFVAGSHVMPRDPQDSTFVDFEDRRDDPSLRFLSFALSPGDALIFHSLAYHWCRGNSENGWRIALTTRWLGDDIRYHPARPHIDEGLTFAGCVSGQPLEGPEFPLVSTHAA
jgi:ectoine hydroxylase-related dioxygenase (phytanoyl-CoA dioxygenase family)